MNTAVSTAAESSRARRVFQWRARRHHHIFASGTGIVLIILLVLAVFWVAVGSCSAS